MTTILITGGAGFIGSNFVRHVAQERPSASLVIVDKLTYAGNLGNLEDVLPKDGSNEERISFHQSDICDPQALDEIFRRYQPAWVVNFAAESHVDRSILDSGPFIATNVVGTQVLLDCARRYHVERFLQVSTDEVYGSSPEGERYHEDSPLSPSNPYAASKAAADLLCLSYFRTFGTPVVITRSSNNYGPYQFPEKLIPMAILSLVRGESIPIYGTGANMRDWLYVTDNCAALLAVLEHGVEGQIYNVGTGEEQRNIDLVETLCRLFNDTREPAENLAVSDAIRFVEDRPGHDQRYALDIKKVRSETGWKAHTSLEKGLQSTLQWYLHNGEWLDHVQSGDYQDYQTEVYQRSWGRT